MSTTLRQHAHTIVTKAIESALPEQAVRKTLSDFHPDGRLFLVSVGKAAWIMANAALDVLSVPITNGIVITKYGHVVHALPSIQCLEAGHPIPDANGFSATQAVLDMTRDLNASDTVLLLLSGGGSALFEKALIPLEELQEITKHLLGCGASITEINTIRKHLSLVKGGRFAQHCSPAKVYAVILSDVLGDQIDVIASGPTVPDSSTCKDAAEIMEKYAISLSAEAAVCLKTETPKALINAQTKIIGSVRQLCAAAADTCLALGYTPILLSDAIDGEAREIGRFLGQILAANAASGKKIALIAGGETVVHLKGNGLGGRNQELALAAAAPISGIQNVCLISVGSDGTDGPTDAAGGYVDGNTFSLLHEKGKNYWELLNNNDAYHALETVNGLVKIGPTGTNVNDIVIGLIG